MTEPTEKMNRMVLYGYAPAFDIENTSGVNNAWVYRRALEGYLYQLHSIDVSGHQEGSMKYGLMNLFDGHEYTHWNLWPGVESRELLYRGQMNDYVINLNAPLYGWECKEFTLGSRSTHETFPFKTTTIIWYTLKKATREELLHYALKHPLRQDTFKRALRGTTLEPGEV